MSTPAPTSYFDPDEGTRSARGKKLYQLWLTSGQTFPPGNYTPWEKLDNAQQGRWIYLSKRMGDPQHQHQVQVPSDVQRFLAATTITEPVDMWKYDEALNPTPEDAHTFVADLASPKKKAPEPTVDFVDTLYCIWVQSRLSRTRQHWWQFTRPLVVDTSRDTFDQLVLDHQTKATADL